MINYSELSNQGYEDWQIQEMRLADKAGVKQEQITAWLMDKRFKYEQIAEIRKGLISGIDVSLYAHLGMSAEEMAEVREKLEASIQTEEKEQTKPFISHSKDIAKLEKLEKSYEQHQNMYLSLVSACMCLAILALIISFLAIIVIVLLLKG